MPTYDELKALCDDLQKQITKSLVVKQDLIDTRSGLDRDLARFRAIQSYSQKAIHAASLQDFAEITVESIIEAFELECSALLLYDRTKKRLEAAATFGVEVSEGKCHLDRDWLVTKKLLKGGTAFIQHVHPEMEPWSSAGLYQVIICPFYDSDEKIEGLLLGGISTNKQVYYDEIKEESVPSFIVFTQQMSSLLHNLESQRVIRDQVEALQKAHDELELRVNERTAELSEANTLLKQEVVERKRMELELQKAKELAEQASRAKSDFLANMSHELRTPMNSVIGFSEMIVDGIYGEVPSEIREVVGEIQKSGEHLLGLINDVLDISKIEAGRMELRLSENAAEECVEAVLGRITSLAKEKGLGLIAEIHEELPLCTFDLQRITQVLYNLVGNAIKFTQEGEVRIGARTEGENLLFWVADTGVGIPESELESIFSEFQQADSSITRDTPGSGLGLAIARRIVEMHGGSIWVESKVGAGSTFWFTLSLRRN